MLKIQAVIKITTLSRSTIYRLIKIGAFPRPVSLSSRRRAWRESDIDIVVQGLYKNFANTSQSNTGGVA